MEHFGETSKFSYYQFYTYHKIVKSICRKWNYIEWNLSLAVQSHLLGEKYRLVRGKNMHVIMCNIVM